MTTLTKRVFRAAIWAVALRFAIKALALVNTIVLARLLLPADFGLVAIVMAIYAFIAILKSFGFDVVLIQKQQAGDSVYNTAWTMQLGFGLVAGLGMFIFAPYIASYYEDPRLENIARVTALLFALNGAVNIGVVNFRKELDFRKEFVYRSAIKFVTVAITIPLAFYLRNYWALVLGSLASAILELGFSYRLSNYRPRVTLREWREIMSFSSWLLFNSFVQFFNRRAVYLIMGRLLNVEATGIYSLSAEFASLPNNELVAGVNRAAFSGYAKISHNQSALRTLYLKTLSGIALIGIPGSVGIAAIAPIFVPVVLGENWLATIPLVHLLGLIFALVSINTNAGYIYHSLGKPHVSAITNACRAICLIALLVIFVSRFGLIGAAYASGVMACIFFPVHFLLLRKYIKLGLGEYLATLYRPIIAAASMYCAVSLFAYGGPVVDLDASAGASMLLLAEMVLLGASVFGAVVLLLWLVAGRPEGIEKQMFELARERLSPKSS